MITDTPPDALDYDELLDELGGDRQLRRQLLELMVESTTQSAALVRTAYGARDCSALANSAHKLKSALVAFGRARLPTRRRGSRTSVETRT